jgi:hypothetical protein
MKYFIDTEFLEGTQKEKFPISLFRKNTPPTIDLISIGIVSEDGREYYAISKDFNLEEAWNRYDLLFEAGGVQFHLAKKVYWIRENVLKPIFLELKEKEVYDNNNSEYTPYFNNYLIKEMINKIWSLNKDKDNFKELKRLLSKYGKTNKEIATEIQEFVYGFAIKGYDENKHQIETTKKLISNFKAKAEFYAYYADYDWVAFCWLFGKMIDLPTGFPMYCNDLKQSFNQKAFLNRRSFREMDIHDSTTTEGMINILKEHPNYPKQTNEHNALADARWNKQLYEFLNTI